MSEAQKHEANVFLPGCLGPVKRTVVLEGDYDALAARLAELEARQGEPLAARMRAAGMLTIDEMLSGAPLDKFIRHAGVHDLETYGQWLDMKCREFLTMQARRDMNKAPEDDLYEWVVAHAAVFQEARINFNVALAAHRAAQSAQGEE